MALSPIHIPTPAAIAAATPAPAPPVVAAPQASVPQTSTKAWVPLLIVGSGALVYITGKKELGLTFAGASELADAMAVLFALLGPALTWFSKNYLRAPVTVETPVGEVNVHIPAGVPWWHPYLRYGAIAVAASLVSVLAARLLW